MTNKTKYNQLREAIKKANISIMDLKCGCKIETKDFTGMIINYTSAGNYMIKIDEGITKTITEKKILKVIGRDITLEDLFLTFLSLGFHHKLGEIGIAGMPKSGLCLIDIKKNGKVMCIISWILNKPLQDQSDEVHNFLWDLICKKQ